MCFNVKYHFYSAWSRKKEAQKKCGHTENYDKLLTCTGIQRGGAHVPTFSLSPLTLGSRQ